MLIKLRMPQNAGNVLDPDADDIRSVLDGICQSVATQADFTVSGFGQDQWPVDVETDLPVFLEQLPEAIRAIQAHTEAELDFYEQGIERRIALTPTNTGSYELSCTSSTNWKPHPDRELLSGDVLSAMLQGVQNEFLRYLQTASPTLAENELVRTWMDPIGVEDRRARESES